MARVEFSMSGGLHCFHVCGGIKLSLITMPNGNASLFLNNRDIAILGDPHDLGERLDAIGPARGWLDRNR